MATRQCFLVLAALTLSATAHAVPASEGLLVETGSPDALCPDLRATREAIRSRLGTLALDGDQQGWTARYTAGHAPGSAGDFVRLELFDPGGARRLVRDLPRSDESCETLSQAIALVVERYFRELAPAPVSAAAPLEPAVPSGSTSEPPRRGASELLSPRLALGVAVGFASAQPGAVAGLQAGYWVWPDLHVELSAAADLGSRSEQLGAARVELRSYPVQLGLGWGRRFHAWDSFVGPELRCTLERARGVGLGSFDPAPGAELSAGLGAGLNWWPASELGLSLRASLDYVLTGTKFRVETGDGGLQQVVRLPALQALATFGVIWGTGS
jgi:hypothetical protein